MNSHPCLLGNDRFDEAYFLSYLGRLSLYQWLCTEEGHKDLLGHNFSVVSTELTVNEHTLYGLIDKLSLKTDQAFVRNDNQLLFINTRRGYRKIRIIPIDEKTLKEFDRIIAPTQEGRILSKEELSKLISIIKNESAKGQEITYEKRISSFLQGITIQVWNQITLENILRETLNTVPNQILKGYFGPYTSLNTTETGKKILSFFDDEKAKTELEDKLLESYALAQNRVNVTLKVIDMKEMQERRGRSTAEEKELKEFNDRILDYLANIHIYTYFNQLIYPFTKKPEFSEESIMKFYDKIFNFIGENLLVDLPLDDCLSYLTTKNESLFRMLIEDEVGIGHQILRQQFWLCGLITDETLKVLRDNNVTHPLIILVQDKGGLEFLSVRPYLFQSVIEDGKIEDDLWFKAIQAGQRKPLQSLCCQLIETDLGHIILSQLKTDHKKAFIDFLQKLLFMPDGNEQLNNLKNKDKKRLSLVLDMFTKDMLVEKLREDECILSALKERASQFIGISKKFSAMYVKAITDVEAAIDFRSSNSYLSKNEVQLAAIDRLITTLDTLHQKFPSIHCEIDNKKAGAKELINLSFTGKNDEELKDMYKALVGFADKQTKKIKKLKKTKRVEKIFEESRLVSISITGGTPNTLHQYLTTNKQMEDFLSQKKPDDLSLTNCNNAAPIRVIEISSTTTKATLTSSQLQEWEKEIKRACCYVAGMSIETNNGQIIFILPAINTLWHIQGYKNKNVLSIEMDVDKINTVFLSRILACFTKNNDARLIYALMDNGQYKCTVTPLETINSGKYTNLQNEIFVALKKLIPLKNHETSPAPAINPSGNALLVERNDQSAIFDNNNENSARLLTHTPNDVSSAVLRLLFKNIFTGDTLEHLKLEKLKSKKWRITYPYLEDKSDTPFTKHIVKFFVGVGQREGEKDDHIEIGKGIDVYKKDPWAEIIINFEKISIDAAREILHERFKIEFDQSQAIEKKGPHHKKNKNRKKHHKQLASFQLDNHSQEAKSLEGQYIIFRAALEKFAQQNNVKTINIKHYLQTMVDIQKELKSPAKDQNEMLYLIVYLLHAMRLFELLSSDPLLKQDGTCKNMRDIIRHASHELTWDEVNQHFASTINELTLIQEGLDFKKCGKFLLIGSGPSTFISAQSQYVDATAKLQKLNNGITLFQDRLTTPKLGKKSKKSSDLASTYTNLLKAISASKLKEEWKIDASLMLCCLLYENDKSLPFNTIYREIGHEPSFLKHQELTKELYAKLLDITEYQTLIDGNTCAKLAYPLC